MIKIFEQHVKNDNAPDGKIAIFRCRSTVDNPTSLINEAISVYVGDKGYNEFVEIHLDNPWIRIVVGGINYFEFVEFTDQTL